MVESMGAPGPIARLRAWWARLWTPRPSSEEIFARTIEKTFQIHLEAVDRQAKTFAALSERMFAQAIEALKPAECQNPAWAEPPRELPKEVQEAIDIAGGGDERLEAELEDWAREHLLEDNSNIEPVIDRIIGGIPARRLL